MFTDLHVRSVRSEDLVFVQSMKSLPDIGPLYNLIHCSFSCQILPLTDILHLHESCTLSGIPVYLNARFVSHKRPQSSIVNFLHYSLHTSHPKKGQSALALQPVSRKTRETLRDIDSISVTAFSRFLAS